jgi:DNA-binding NtrC family response regulator
MSKKMRGSLPVVLVDDESTVLLSSRMILASAGVKDVLTIEDSRDLMPLLAEQEVALVVLDLFMPYRSGTELLPEIVQRYPELPVIVMTANQEVETAVVCMKDGAFDYLIKPIEENRFVSSVKRALELRMLRRQLGTLRRSLMTDQLENREAFSAIVTVSRKMHSLFQYIEAIAGSDEPLLIIGETGTGKELLAEAVHKVSGRTGEFVAVNTAGLDDTLFSDTLFGHCKGAFSGADTARDGMVARAAGGTLFLDEIGDLSASSQVKLLRMLQDGRYYALGSDVAKKGDVRILCATHRDLDAKMAEEAFRADLYYRLSVHQVDIPPLRRRKEDIPALTTYFAGEAARSLDKKPVEVPPELLTLLVNYHFPGNVRELRSIVFDAVARHKSGSSLGVKSLRKMIRNKLTAAPIPEKADLNRDGSAEERFPTLKEAECLHIQEALQRAGNNQGTAAMLLGISRPALNRRLAKMRKK